MTVNHCLFLVHIDISFILVALHLRMKPAQPTIILRFDLCVISKLELNKNALKSGGNSRLLGYWIRNEEAINFKRNRINSLKHALPTLLMVEYSSKSGYVLFLTFYIVFDDLFLNWFCTRVSVLVAQKPKLICSVYGCVEIIKHWVSYVWINILKTFLLCFFYLTVNPLNWLINYLF